MESYLFDDKRISLDIEKKIKELEDIKKHSYFSSQKISEIKREISYLNSCLNFALLLDTGEKNESIMTGTAIEPLYAGVWPNRVDEIEMISWRYTQDYLNREHLAEISVVSNMGGCHSEHALLFLYVANGGAVACLNGMRNITHNTFVAQNDFPRNVIADDLLRNYIIRPVQKLKLVFYSAPVRIPPETDWREITSAVNNFLHKNVPMNDGFILYSHPDFYKIFGLARPDWWKE